jgi:hypothetical protein
MTYIELTAALMIFFLFLAGLGQAALPVMRAYSRAAAEYQEARALEFVAESFKKECRKRDRNITRWKRDVSIVPQLESYEIKELRGSENAVVLQLICVIGGERFEIWGLCRP